MLRSYIWFVKGGIHWREEKEGAEMERVESAWSSLTKRENTQHHAVKLHTWLGLTLTLEAPFVVIDLTELAFSDSILERRFFSSLFLSSLSSDIAPS